MKSVSIQNHRTYTPHNDRRMFPPQVLVTNNSLWSIRLHDGTPEDVRWMIHTLLASLDDAQEVAFTQGPAKN